ncbi:hypothetical protein ABVT39_015754 [Epinephelus coioides]
MERPGKAVAAASYATAGKYEDVSVKEIGVFAGAGFGHACAEWSVLDAEAKGPNASAGAEFSRAAGVKVLVKGDLGVSTGRSQLVIDTMERPGKAVAAASYATAGKYEDVSVKEIGVYAGAGLGHACAEWSVLDAEAKGPNASAGAEISKAAGVKAMAKAELASASAAAGPVKAKIGLAADTGIGFGLSGLEAKVLGTGFTIGRRTGISFLGSGFEIRLW